MNLEQCLACESDYRNRAVCRNPLCQERRVERWLTARLSNFDATTTPINLTLNKQNLGPPSLNGAQTAAFPTGQYPNSHSNGTETLLSGSINQFPNLFHAQGNADSSLRGQTPSVPRILNQIQCPVAIYACQVPSRTGLEGLRGDLQASHTRQCQVTLKIWNPFFSRGINPGLRIVQPVPPIPNPALSSSVFAGINQLNRNIEPLSAGVRNASGPELTASSAPSSVQSAPKADASLKKIASVGGHRGINPRQRIVPPIPIQASSSTAFAGLNQLVQSIGFLSAGARDALGAESPASSKAPTTQIASSGEAKVAKWKIIRTGYCLLCESDFKNILEHGMHRHTEHANYKIFYTTICVLSLDQRILHYKFTNINELKKCPSCNRVFYKHRCYRHGCNFPTSSTEMDAAPESNAGETDSQEVEKKFGRCLMCKFNFDDLIHHRKLWHLGNEKYQVRQVYGETVLLPEETLDKNLRKCSNCGKVAYRNEIRNMRCCAIQN